MADASPYDDLVMDHIRNARNYRVLEDAHHQATGTNPLCGDEITVFLRLEDDVLAEIAFQCTCCGVAMASASMMTEQLRGVRAADARSHARAFAEVVTGAAAAGPNAASPVLAAMLETVRRYPVRSRCAALPWTTLRDILGALPRAR